MKLFERLTSKVVGYHAYKFKDGPTGKEHLIIGLTLFNSVRSIHPKLIEDIKSCDLMISQGLIPKIYGNAEEIYRQTQHLSLRERIDIIVKKENIKKQRQILNIILCCDYVFNSLKILYFPKRYISIDSTKEFVDRNMTNPHFAMAIVCALINGVDEQRVMPEYTNLQYQISRILPKEKRKIDFEDIILRKFSECNKVFVAIEDNIVDELIRKLPYTEIQKFCYLTETWVSLE